jgi:hypothetical protein
MPEGISFQAILKQIRTTTDGGWTVSFDVSANCAQELMDLSKLRDQLLQIAAIPINCK